MTHITTLFVRGALGIIGSGTDPKLSHSAHGKSEISCGRVVVSLINSCSLAVYKITLTSNGVNKPRNGTAPRVS